MTMNVCYIWNIKCNISIIPTMIIIHSTATPGVKAHEWFSRWNHSLRKVGIHAFIDDLEFWQYLPYNMWAWGVGGKANGYSIQIEMCEDEGWDEGYFRKVLANTIKKVAEWCVNYNIPVSRVIAHYEAYLAGLGSNHGDPRHWWSKFGYTMDNFRADVQKAIDGPVVAKPDKPIDEKICIENLNVRYGPGTNFKILTTMPQGTKAVIYSVSGTWARVKYNGIMGYCSAAYLKESLIGYVTASVLNMRSGPGTGNGIIKTLRKGTSVTLYGLENGWWETPTGYISADWISLDKAPAPIVVAPRVQYAIVTAKPYLNVRDDANGKKIGILKDGSEVWIMGSKPGWYKVAWGPNQGWVSAQYLKLK